MAETKKRKVYKEILDPSWAEALLYAPSGLPDDSHPEEMPPSIYQRLEKAREDLRLAVEQARKALAQNPLSAVVARDSARRAGKRGEESIIIDSDGLLKLEVLSNTKPRVKKVAPHESPEETEQDGSPTIEPTVERKPIEQGIDKKQDTEVPKPGPSKSKRVKRGPALSPAQIIATPEVFTFGSSGSPVPSPPPRVKAVPPPPVIPPPPKTPPPPGSMASFAAHGVKVADDLEDFLASIEDVE